MGAIKFFWTATSGHRFAPWRSPYLRWRMETYSGRPADTIDAGYFFSLLWAERRQMMRFLRWLSEMEHEAKHEG